MAVTGARWLRVGLAAVAWLALAADASAWWNKSWQYRRKLTIDNSAQAASYSYVWVRVPSVAASSSTGFTWMSYGNTAATGLPLAGELRPRIQEALDGGLSWSRD